MTSPAAEKVLARVADHLLPREVGRPLRVAVDGITPDGKTAFARELAASIAFRGRPAIALSNDDIRFHHMTIDELVRGAADQSDGSAVVVVDGTFLQRPKLSGGWDEVVYLDTRPSLRSAAALRYLQDFDPLELADIVIDHQQPDEPRLIRVGGPAGKTVRLFSYGTLQQENVQLSRFGRVLDGVPDTLPEHRIGWLTITDPAVIAASGSDRHPIVLVSGPQDSVAGTVFTISTTELAAADTYEVADYRRVLVSLGSGLDAWCYLRAA